MGSPEDIEKALETIAPVDVAQQLAERIARLPEMKKRSRARQEPTVPRNTLALSLAGDDDAACSVMAEAWAKALHAYEITPGREAVDGPWIRHIEWRDLVMDKDGGYLERRKATDAAYAAKSEAENGVLVIHNVFTSDGSNAADNAKNGALDQLCQLLVDYADKDYTPALVVTGAPDKLNEFFRENRYLAELFNSASVLTGPLPKPPVPDMPVETEKPLTVGKPLQLKPGSAP